jgi:hypothetical protein
MTLPLLSFLIAICFSNEWALVTANWATSWKTVALERHQRRFLTGKKHDSSFAGAEKEMK